MKTLLWPMLALGLAAAGCGDGETMPTDDADYKHPLPEGTSICGRSDLKELWPYSIRSQRLPILVHYYRPSELETAQKVLEYTERGWDYHVGKNYFRAPLTDGGECGPDENFDVFVWKGHRSCLVNVLSGDPASPWDDRRGYAVIDAWGPYGGDELEETVVHEMAHASQAADDWYESPILFEMSAVFEDQLYADRYIKTYFDDFQLHPDWALDRNDNYDTWYMYGSSMYLLFLKDRYFGGNSRFASQMWLGSRNPPGAQDDQTKNEPDFADALDELLRKQSGTSYVGSVPEFARWRYYTGDHVDDNHFRHFKNGIENLKQAKLALAAQQEAVPGRISINNNAPMLLGSSYIELTAGASTPATVYVSLDAPADATRRFVVQAVPGLNTNSDGEILDLASGPQLLSFPADKKRTLIITALPTGPYDPDTRSEDRYPFSIVLADKK